jgi:DNA-binding SARP family transcriptional activator
MDIRVLGPLAVSHHGRDATPTARKQRQVLSLLLLNAGEVVSTDALIREIWDQQPPRTVQTPLQTYVLQIRKQLAHALDIPVAVIARSVLVTRNGGYLLMLPDATVDLHQYRSLERDGMRVFEAGDDDDAVRLFNQALALWRGRALADVELGRILEPEAARLEQSRLTLVECRLEAELRRGRHRELLGELISLTAQHTYNENLYAQYMLALYRSGRRGTALEAYHKLRGLMIDELGLEPSSRLQQLHHAVIAEDPALDEPGARWPIAAAAGQ